MESPSVPGEITDKRLIRGARTRQLVLARAVDIASLENLEALSFGHLAADVGLSKAGIQTLFRTKEQLQLATVDHARDRFIAEVSQPARTKPHGVQRLRELIDRWIVYATTPVFEGGCFQAANLSEFDSRPGPIRDALVRNQQQWVDLLAYELGRAVEAGEIAPLDTDLAAFQIAAVLLSVNTALRLGDTTAADKIHRIVDGLLVRR
ncbi:TetR/AcrR family transcriptional regulator [Nocardia sp. SYP-A9097]|uniref:TetR/AcrR family transcriptional regulator n=1 Tax=Nocardia sp. SYP-A9097 TaxID=2663237 RepID=UPI00129BFAEB|nr:TetR/AcrR family transcriptional regulator [Nocardia sp. SYP-A9097]MRH91505.1 TetR/AcrR family transcriptional regulator [Nocardia sp. SYP-A9097]